MDAFEKTGYSILGTLALLWVIAILWGAIAALPYGLLGLLAYGTAVKIKRRDIQV
jgi:hypothetical protein